MSVTNKTRFETFKLDNFTCQYCGRSAPEATLHIDHIQSTLKSGDDDIHNLVTVCTECNQGKNAGVTTTTAVVKKRMIRLGELQERRKEIEMEMEWPGMQFDLELAAKYPDLVRVGAGTFVQ